MVKSIKAAYYKTPVAYFIAVGPILCFIRIPLKMQLRCGYIVYLVKLSP